MAELMRRGGHYRGVERECGMRWAYIRRPPGGTKTWARFPTVCCSIQPRLLRCRRTSILRRQSSRRRLVPIGLRRRIDGCLATLGRRGQLRHFDLFESALEGADGLTDAAT